MAKGVTFKKGDLPHNYKGKIIRRGYISIKMNGHNLATKQGYVKEYRLVM